eukprot:PhF_6_TR29399/c3_g1_i1/m.43399
MSEKVPLSFTVLGKVFTYEGNPANRERQLFDLIAQRGISESDIPNVYRDNFTEAIDDATIFQRYQARLQKRQKSSGNKSQDPLPTTPVVTQPSPSQDDSTTSVVNTSNTATPPTQPPTARGGSGVGAALVPGGAAPPPMSPAEVEEINRYITDVLQEGGGSAPRTPNGGAGLQPPAGMNDYGDLTPQNTLESTQTQMQQQVGPDKSQQQQPTPVPPPQPQVAGGTKMHIFLHVEGAESQKMLSWQRGGPFSEFLDAVQRKLGMAATLSFVDEDGMRIDVDDEDALEMFLSQSSTKKFVLKCVCARPPPTPVVVQAQPAVGKGAGLPSGPPAPQPQVNDVTIATPSDGVTAAGTKLPAKSPSSTVVEQPLVRTFLGHTAAVYGCAWSPDGTQIVSSSRDHTVRIWSVDRGTALQTIKAHNTFVLCCDYSPKGTHVVSCSDDLTIKLWNTQGKKMYMLKEHTDKVYCTQFLGGGDLMASCSCDCTVKVWNVDTGSRVASLKPHEKPIFRIGVSQSDGGRLLTTSCDDHTSYILDWKESKIVRKLIGHTSTVWCSQFSSDDRYVVTSSMDQTIRMWDVGTGKEVCSFTGHGTPVHAAMLCKRSRDTALLSCARDWTIGIWDVASTKLSTTFAAHTNTVYNIAQKDDMLVSCSLDESLKLWKLPRRVIDGEP